MTSARPRGITESASTGAWTDQAERPVSSLRGGPELPRRAELELPPRAEQQEQVKLEAPQRAGRVKLGPSKQARPGLPLRAEPELLEPVEPRRRGPDRLPGSRIPRRSRRPMTFRPHRWL